MSWDNRSFARSGHMVRNKLNWDANNAVGLPKHRNSCQSSATFLCFESSTALFASQHNLFRTMWPDRAKGLFGLVARKLHSPSVIFTHPEKCHLSQENPRNDSQIMLFRYLVITEGPGSVRFRVELCCSGHFRDASLGSQIDWDHRSIWCFILVLMINFWHFLEIFHVNDFCSFF